MNVDSLTITLLTASGLRKSSGNDSKSQSGFADSMFQKLQNFQKCVTWAEMTLIRPDSDKLRVKSTARRHPTGDCSFFEEFTFPLTSSHDMVIIELKERRGDVMTRDRTLGSAELSLIR